jgi:SAM-dependent methyltransferase
MPISSRRGGEDERATLYPPELLPVFDDAFITSWDLFEEYVARLTLTVFRATRLEQACKQAATVGEAIARAGLALPVARVPTAWILAMLASRGWVEVNGGAEGDTTYRLKRPLPTLEPDEILEAQAARDASCLPSYRLAAMAAAHYPAVLRAETTGEQALFGSEGIVAWVKYFSNGNPLYAVSNAVGAIAAEQALPDGPGSILEIGGGLGSGAQALLDRLDFAGRAKQISVYHFTEISGLFLKRAQRTLVPRYPGCQLTFSTLDIDRPFSDGDVRPRSYSLVYGVNVLHVARDLAQTLGELRTALAPGGVLVMAECVRPFPGTPLHPEFVFNLLSSFRDPVLVPTWRPNGGFLTPEQWTAALEANGFADVRIYPDIAAIREAYPAFVVAAIVGRRA